MFLVSSRVFANFATSLADKPSSSGLLVLLLLLPPLPPLLLVLHRRVLLKLFLGWELLPTNGTDHAVLDLVHGQVTPQTGLPGESLATLRTHQSGACLVPRQVEHKVPLQVVGNPTLSASEFSGERWFPSYSSCPLPVLLLLLLLLSSSCPTHLSSSCPLR